MSEEIIIGAEKDSGVECAGRIVTVTEMFDDIECRVVYQVTIVFEDSPKLNLGKCVVKQGSTTP